MLTVLKILLTTGIQLSGNSGIPSYIYPFPLTRFEHPFQHLNLYYCSSFDVYSLRYVMEFSEIACSKEDVMFSENKFYRKLRFCTRLCQMCCISVWNRENKNSLRKPNTAKLKMLQARFDWVCSWKVLSIETIVHAPNTGVSRMQHESWCTS
jgi:hypothetical protein